MSASSQALLKALSPRIINRVLMTLDKSTAVVISASWLAALVMVILAVFAVHGAVSAKKDAALIEAVEPSLPITQTTPITAKDIQTIATQLQRQFPDVKIEATRNQTLILKADDGAKFHQWITALSYIDTMAPKYRWALREFCVGSCGGTGLMMAVVSGQRMDFSRPSKP